MNGLKVKSTLIGAGLMLCVAPALAAPMTVDNIQIPTSPGGNQEITGAIYQGTVNGSIGSTLSGYGVVDRIGGNSDFCATGSSCQLTFIYDGYTVTSITNNAANFDGGYVNFYANDTQTFDKNDPSTATDGQLFLTTQGDTVVADSNDTLLGTGFNFLSNEAQGNGNGHLDVDNTGSANGNPAAAAGDANSVFDTNSFDDHHGGTSDLLLNAGFSPGGPSVFNGSADVHYATGSNPPPAVPEPSSLAIIGFGLLLLALGASWRRRYNV